MNDELLRVLQDMVDMLYRLGAGKDECEELMARIYKLSKKDDK